MTSTHKRRKSRVVTLGSIRIGGGNPVSIQTMLTESLPDVARCAGKIRELERIGCDIVRIAVKSEREIPFVKDILKEVSLPLVADIQFRPEHALKAIDCGFQGIRINPGYLTDRNMALKIIERAAGSGCVIRIGYNSGSLPHEILNGVKRGRSRLDAIMDSVRSWVAFFEDQRFSGYKISVKSSSVIETIELNQALAGVTDAPIHLGVTEAGDLLRASVRSGIALGALLREGIGDTIRVSITGDPRPEVTTAREILNALGLSGRGVSVISCPTCSRCALPLEKMVSEVALATLHVKAHIRVAIMGCAVNGPGEAREADFGIAGVSGEEVAFFRSGERIKNLRAEDAAGFLVREIENYEREQQS